MTTSSQASSPHNSFTRFAWRTDDGGQKTEDCGHSGAHWREPEIDGIATCAAVWIPGSRKSAPRNDGAPFHPLFSVFRPLLRAGGDDGADLGDDLRRGR